MDGTKYHADLDDDVMAMVFFTYDIMRMIFYDICRIDSWKVDNSQDQEDELISICRHTLSQVDDIYTNGHI